MDQLFALGHVFTGAKILAAIKALNNIVAVELI
jgi:hypothetical protein